MQIQKENPEIDVVIPVYRPDERLRRLLLLLRQQTVQPSRILLVNTEESLFDPSFVEGIDRIEVVHIKKEEFDHGGTRHMAAAMLHGAFLLFLTQDAVPADTHLIENLYRRIETPLENELAARLKARAASQNPEFADAGRICTAYACQLPNEDCGVLEAFTRQFNYGAEDRIKTEEDLETLGIKTFFCSDVCAMYRRSAYEALGGFVRRTIFNEDMIFASKVIRSGGAVAYCADAKVIHSHNYSGLQQFHRNFDLGVSQAEHPEVFADVPSEQEGMRMVKQTAAYLCSCGKWYLIGKLIWQSGWKYLGYRLGKQYQKLPMPLIKKCSASPGYWKQNPER